MHCLKILCLKACYTHHVLLILIPDDLDDIMGSAWVAELIKTAGPIVQTCSLDLTDSITTSGSLDWLPWLSPRSPWESTMAFLRVAVVKITMITMIIIIIINSANCWGPIICCWPVTAAEHRGVNSWVWSARVKLHAENILGNWCYTAGVQYNSN